MKNDKRPVGIIRTIPSLDGETVQSGTAIYRKSLGLLSHDKIEAIYIALDKKPVHDVLYIYLLVDGRIDVRLNIAGYRTGAEAKEIKCWDGQIRTPNYWAVCCGPVVYPSQKLPWRGFQGFRYVYEELFEANGRGK